MPLSSSFLFFFFFFLLLLLHFSPTRPESEPETLRLKLIRRAQDPTLTRLDRIRGLVHNDRLRRHRAAASPAPSPPGAFEMPVRSGAYAGTGQYFVRVRVGTPAQRFLLVADTGSDLTWVKCSYGSRKCGKKKCGSDPDAERVFRADRSRTFHPISCGSDLCRNDLPFSLTTCPTPASPCDYDYGYFDGSSTQGFYANESVTIALSDGHKKRKLKGLLLGCTSSSSGPSFDSSDGVLGLGHSDISFASHATAQFGGRFSYCLVDHLSPKNATSYLTFGPNRMFRAAPAVQETDLLITPKLDPYYGAAVIGLSVDGEVLRIPPSVWNVGKGGGAILDSGSSLTMLAEPAYRVVVSALSRRLVGIPEVKEDPFEYCYNWTRVGNITVPKLAVHFAGRAQLDPPVKSYLIDVAAGVKCLGFTSVAWPSVSTIGNIMQQEHLWEFDIQNRRLRFQRSTCTTT
ncbi:uncharacterized protein M6B38_351190 [Iris pallida]|uniref:Peptidase A1 domain-containing protein n=1 Tax=Iris pallida TaxID=29817 RepID=A0AAX6GQZ7_IRIPA|nr:uncharacterized protein M6B38_351190 [Iris pallida]